MDVINDVVNDNDIVNDENHDRAITLLMILMLFCPSIPSPFYIALGEEKVTVTTEQIITRPKDNRKTAEPAYADSAVDNI